MHPSGAQQRKRVVCRVSLGHGPGTEQDVGAEGWGLLQGRGSGSRGLRCGDQGQGWSPDCPPRTQQNSPATHPCSLLLTLPSRASSTETSRKKKYTWSPCSKAWMKCGSEEG